MFLSLFLSSSYTILSSILIFACKAMTILRISLHFTTDVVTQGKSCTILWVLSLPLPIQYAVSELFSYHVNLCLLKCYLHKDSVLHCCVCLKCTLCYSLVRLVSVGLTSQGGRSRGSAWPELSTPTGTSSFLMIRCLLLMPMWGNTFLRNALRRSCTGNLSFWLHTSCRWAKGHSGWAQLHYSLSLTVLELK